MDKKQRWNQLIYYLHLSDKGDAEAFDKACAIGREISKEETCQRYKTNSMRVVTHDTDIVYNSIEAVIKRYHVSRQIVKKCLETGEADRQGRFYFAEGG